MTATLNADVSFEGFWGSRIGGTYGGTGRTVRFAMPKQVVSPMTLDGSVAQVPNARLTVRSTASFPPSTELTAELVIDTLSTVTANGDLRLQRSVLGGGTLELIAPASLLDVRAAMGDSVLIRIGSDSVVSRVFASRAFSVPRMTIHPSSTLAYAAGDSVDVTRELRYRIAVAPGFSMMSAAVDPFDPRPTAVFPGASSPAFMFDNVLGYVVSDSIRPGIGYWISFPAAAVIEQRGRIINVPRSVPARGEWNIIGASSIPSTLR